MKICLGVLQERRNSLVPILKDKRKAHSGCSIRAKGNDYVLHVDGKPYITATDMEGKSDEARQLREQYGVDARGSQRVR